jgi:hypothetical protein
MKDLFDPILVEDTKQRILQLRPENSTNSVHSTHNSGPSSRTNTLTIICDSSAFNRIAALWRAGAEHGTIKSGAGEDADADPHPPRFGLR